MREVETTDELGLTIVQRRHHATLRLRPGTAIDADAATEVLAATRDALHAWDRPVGL